MHNYAHESKRKLGRNHSKERPQSERKAEIAESGDSGKRPRSERKAGSDRIQNGNKPILCFGTMKPLT